jgi:hypothetical protein
LNLSTVNEQDKKKLKRNMIISHLRSTLYPYFNAEERQEYRAERVFDRQSEIDYSEITDYEDFKSEMDGCETAEIDLLIKEEIARKKR